ncbi:hypothetical protein TNIN_2571 [Trichonephila inaurata madagascariensis]|uniref:Uncharacterized protein n=1 Tax=Trichonephila inaurata madagascariensis TaxID=2747483 RepID=A0A8X7CP60_9ARAC|nr:hypothetical protein TNIN_2571 [Trichonephila inaurata madagascariensis]
MLKTYATNNILGSSSNKTTRNDRTGGWAKRTRKGQKGVEVVEGSLGFMCACGCKASARPQRTIISCPESVLIDQQLLCSCSPFPGLRPRNSCRCRAVVKDALIVH